MRFPLGLTCLVLCGLVIGTPQATSDTVPPIPSGNWSGLGGALHSWADPLHGWRFRGPRNEQGFFPTIEATEDRGKHWRTVFHLRRRTDGVIWMNRLSRRVGVVVALIGPERPALLTEDNGEHWRPVHGGRWWHLFEGDERALYVSRFAPPWRYSPTLYRLAPWPSTRPRYIRVFDAPAPERIVSLRKAPNGVVALLHGLSYHYSIAVHRGGRTQVFDVSTTGLDQNPPVCDVLGFSVQWPVLRLVTAAGGKCEAYAVEHVSRDGGRTWTATRV